MRSGYDDKFLGNDIVVPMPTVELEFEDEVYRSDRLRDGYIVDYEHYSVVMSTSTKQALFSAANVDQEQFSTGDPRKWWVDPRIGLENSVGPAAYKKNVWDRGHFTRRAAVAWGSKKEAKRASIDSCSYANASLQHENFNQDEWREVEDWVYELNQDENNKICVFTGPLFTEMDRWYHKRTMREPVRIPAAFWKVIVFKGKDSGKIETRAFIMYQDELAADKKGRRDPDFKLMRYQVTITEIEEATGLEFGEELYDSNPLYYYESDFTREHRLSVPEALPLENSDAFVSTPRHGEW